MSQVIQGVEFAVPLGERIVRALATHDLLESVFGARPDPNSWMKAYSDHCPELHSAVADVQRRRRRPERRDAVVLSAKLWGQLKGTSDDLA